MPPAPTDTHTDPLLADLTEPQRQAVTHVDGPLLVLAGAGSGKTRVITRRIAYLVQRIGVPPWNILAITFTNKAAGEMRDRIAQLLSPARTRYLTIATFHSFCARILRQFAQRLNLPPGFSIYDTADQERALKQAMDELSISASNFPPSRVLATISNAKNELIDPEAFAHQAADHYTRTVARIYPKYQALLRHHNALDFDDLLVCMVQLLRDHADVRAELQDRFRYILIDEYQDTNHAQFVIAYSLAATHHNICATGDPDQSIYAWRGADIRNILDFEKHFPNARVVRLEQNYRSTKNILAVADHLIRHNHRRKHKNLWTHNPAGTRVQVVTAQDELDEAAFTVDLLRRLHEEENIPWGDMAVFYRINSLSRVIEDALRNAAIPYQVARGTAFYDRKEIRDALAYLRVIANPQDQLSLLRIINTPARGISDATIQHLQAQALAHGLNLFDLIHQPDLLTALNPRAQAAVRRFAQLLDAWRTLAGFAPSTVASSPAPATTSPSTAATPSDSPSLRSFVEQVLRESGLHKFYAEDPSDPDRERLANLGELVSSAQQFEQELASLPPQENAETPAPPLTLAEKLLAWLERISLVSDVDTLQDGQGAVSLMSLHAAKGLEFSVVVILGLEDGLLPHERAHTDADQLEEERRLCFVGITRAMRHLALTHARFRSFFGQATPTIPSRFLSELPPDHIDVLLTPAAEVFSLPRSRRSSPFL